MLILSLFVYFYNFILSFFTKKISYGVLLFFYTPYLLILGVFACINVEFLSVDYHTYVNWMSYIVWSDELGLLNKKDPLFQYFVTELWRFFNNFEVVFYFFIIFSIILKYVIGVLFVNKDIIWFYFILVFSRLYILHDITQIRASVAISICMLSYYLFFHKNMKKISIILFFIGFYFHKSVLVFFICFLSSFFDSFYKARNFNIISIIAALFIYFFNNFFYSIILQKTFDSRLGVYLDDNYDNFAKISLFSFYVLLKFLTISINYLYWDCLGDNEKRINFFVIIGLFFQVIFSESAVLGWRFSEIFVYFDILSLILIYKYVSVNYKYLYYIFGLFISCICLYTTYFANL